MRICMRENPERYDKFDQDYDNDNDNDNGATKIPWWIFFTYQ